MSLHARVASHYERSEPRYDDKHEPHGRSRGWTTFSLLILSRFSLTFFFFSVVFSPVFFLLFFHFQRLFPPFFRLISPAVFLSIFPSFLSFFFSVSTALEAKVVTYEEAAEEAQERADTAETKVLSLSTLLS